MKHIAITSLIVLTLILSGCTSSNTDVLNDDSTAISYPVDPAAKCNHYSTSKKILITSPCKGDTTATLKGMVTSDVQVLDVKVMQGGQVVTTEQVYPLPSNAAGNFKDINATLDVTELSGATIEISANGEVLAITL